MSEPATPSHSNTGSSRWKAGILSAASAALLSLALAAPGMAAQPEPSSLFATPRQATAILAKHGPELSAMPASAGTAMASTLSAYSGLPPATIVMARMDPDQLSEGSRAVVDIEKNGKLSCNILIVVDQQGNATLTREMATTMGFVPGPALKARLDEFETLHELGHCSSIASELEFNHPDASKEDNQKFRVAFAGAEKLQSLWAESYADAYAALTILTRANASSPENYARALEDMRFIRNFRISERRLLSPSYSSDPAKTSFDILDGHLNEHSLTGLLASPAAWLSDSRTIEAKASEIASKGLVQAFAQAPSSDASAYAMFTPKGYAESLLQRVAEQFAQRAADPQFQPNDKGKKSFVRQALAEATRPSGSPESSTLENRIEVAFQPLMPKIADAVWNSVHPQGKKSVIPEAAAMDALDKLTQRGVLAKIIANMRDNGSGATLRASGDVFLGLSSEAKKSPLEVPNADLTLYKSIKARADAGDGTLNEEFADIASCAQALLNKLAKRTTIPELQANNTSINTLFRR